jgi:hypothetical protein
MVRIAAYTGLLVSLAADAAPSGPSLVGTWQLVSRADKGPTGCLIPEPTLGAIPTGYLIYNAGGHVAAQLAARDRPSTVCDTAPT